MIRLAVLAGLLCVTGCAQKPPIELPWKDPVDPTTNASFRAVPRAPDVAAYPTEREHVWSVPSVGRSFVTVRVLNHTKPRPLPVPPLARVLQPPPVAPIAPTLQQLPVWEATVYFDTGRSSLDGKARSDLDRLLSSVGSLDSVTLVTVDGFSDSVGSTSFNDRLSAARAASVKAYVVSKGVPPRVVNTAAHGESSPAAPNSTASGRAVNRRATLHLEGDRRP